MSKKKGITILSIIAILSVFVCAIIISGEMNQRQQGTCTKVIDTSDEYDEGTMSIPFKAKHSGHYIVRVNYWPEEEPGVLTGFYLNDKNGNRLVGATAQKLMFESKPVYMEKGEYKLVFQIIRNNEQYLDFYNSHLLNDFEFAPWDGFKETSMSMDYEVIFERSPRDYMPILYLLVGVIGIAIAFICVVSFKQGKTTKSDYDERMLVSRLKSEAKGYWVMITALIILFLLSAANTDFHVEESVIFIFVILLGITVNAVSSIFRDGYFALNDNKKSFVIFLSILALGNLAMSIRNIVKGYILADGTVTRGVIPILLFLMLTAVLISIACKEKAKIEED